MSQAELKKQAVQNLQDGNPIPFQLIWNGASLILGLIKEAIANRSTLRARVKVLEGVCLTQAKQIEVLETRLTILEGGK